MFAGRPDPMYALLDTFFFTFHATLIVFLMTGWAWRALRTLHLGVTTLTLLSWFGLGFFYGFGYCPSTDWHWQVKRKLGQTDLDGSFVKYCLDQLMTSDLDPLLVDLSVLVLGLAALVASAWLNWRDRQQSRASGVPASVNNPHA